jgi:hypothetical protein
MEDLSAVQVLSAEAVAQLVTKIEGFRDGLSVHERALFDEMVVGEQAEVAGFDYIDTIFQSPGVRSAVADSYIRQFLSDRLNPKPSTPPTPGR